MQIRDMALMLLTESSNNLGKTDGHGLAFIDWNIGMTVDILNGPGK